MTTPGTLRYNGYEFNELTNVEVSAQAIYDDAQRTVAHVEYTITAKSVIYARTGDNGTEQHLDDIRRLLQEPGKPFLLADWGFGPDIQLNGLGEPRDVKFGPRPQSLEIRPIGHTLVSEIEWSVIVAVPACTGAITEGLMSMNYAIDYAISVTGHTTRTITGYLEIALTRELNDTVADSVDAYRDLIAPPVLPNFEREQNYSTSSDQRRLDYTITDREIASPNAYPAGVTQIQARHRSKVNLRARSRADHELSCRIELVQNQPRRKAWDIFRAIVAKRLEQPIAAERTVMFDDLEIAEELFTNEIEFTLSFRVILYELQELLTGNGHFESLNGTWEQWRAALGNARDQRGWAQLESLPINDALVDLCNQVPAGYPIDSSLTTSPAPDPIDSFCNSTPPPEKSYVHFEGTLYEESTYGKVFSTELGEVDVQSNGFSPSDLDSSMNEIDGLGSLEKVISEAPPSLLWRWRGYAERLGYPIPKPDKLTIDNITLLKVGKTKWIHKNKGDYFCVPLYAAGWDFLYRVIEQPTRTDSENPDPNSQLS